MNLSSHEKVVSIKYCARLLPDYLLLFAGLVLIFGFSGFQALELAETPLFQQPASRPRSLPCFH